MKLGRLNHIGVATPSIADSVVLTLCRLHMPRPNIIMTL
jgi:hypothetical protein